MGSIKDRLFGGTTAGCAAVAVLALVAGLPTGAGAVAARAGGAGTPAAVAHGPRSAVPWTTCTHGIPKPFQCATVPVPLDYQNPGGRKIGIALLRLPAAHPAKRIGSLFVDFGGPGGPDITDLVNRAYTVFSAPLRARFDLVTWDPRGVEYSDPVNCFASVAASNTYFNSIPVFPYPQSTEPGYFAANAKLGAKCARRAAPLLGHVSSADTARDLDLLRRAVGDSKLTYWGFSYGTVIGATYASLFPGHVRAMILDGTLDFTGNATGHHPGDAAKFPIDVRQGVDRAGQRSFGRFLALCARAGRNCAFSPGNPAAKWATLLARAQAGQISYQNLMIFAYYDMENPIADWPGLASELQSLYTSTQAGRAAPARVAAGLARAARLAASRATMRPVPELTTGRGAARSVPGLTAGPAAARPAAHAARPVTAARYTANRSEAYYAIQCADSLVPTKTSVYHDLAISEDNKVPGFGRLIVYDTMPCATWPDMHTDAYDGPWNLSQAPILVVNARYDPITPIWGARAAVRELGDARLLTVNGDGHTSMYVEPSRCRDAAQLAYFTSLTLPPAGTVCPVDQLPFGLSPGHAR